MSLSGLTQIDYRDPKLLAFVNARRVAGDALLIPPDETARARNFEIIGRRGRPASIGDFEVCTAIRRRYKVFKNNQVFSSFELVMPLFTKLELNIDVSVGCLTTLDANAKDAIRQAIIDFQPGTDDLEKYVQQKFEAYNATAATPVSSADFDLFSFQQIIWLERKLDDSEEIKIRESYYGNGASVFPNLFLPSSEQKNFHDQGYDLKQDGEDEYLSTYSPYRPPASQIIEVPAGTDLDNAGDAVRGRAAKDAQASDCQALTIIDHEVTRQRWADEIDPELRTKWRVYPNGCGGSFSLPYLTKLSRSRDIALYVTATSDTPEAIFKGIIDSSLKEAADYALVILILTLDLSSGLSEFQRRFWELIKEKTEQTFRCLIPSAYLVIICGEWKEDLVL